MENLSPMMRQYQRIKEKHKDHILFFRMGDFYEMFFEDALLASRELELTLTGRDCGQEERAPMCGVPHFSSETYVAKLIKKGYKVAICEQMEDPATVKGLVSREVVRVVTPGTLLEGNLLEEDVNNYICCIYCDPSGYGLAIADISTGEVNLIELEDGESSVTSELGKYMPKEIIFNSLFLDKKEIAGFIREKLACTADLADDEYFSLSAAREQVLNQFQKENLEDLNLADKERAVRAAGGLLGYLGETQRVGMERLITLKVQNTAQSLYLDLTAVTNLELLQTIRTKEKRGSLLWVLDKTKTPMGKRLIRGYLTKPLIHPALIEKRLNAVEELVEGQILCMRLVERLSGIFDIERLITRIVYGNATPRDIKALEQTIVKLPAIVENLRDVKTEYLTDIRDEIDPLEDLAALIGAAIVDEPPVSARDGGVIKAGCCEELDRLRSVMAHSKEYLARIESDEREKTGIKNLKIGYNKVFGYYIEVTKSNLDMVPETYIRKQTLTNCERYIIQELKDLEDEILGANERALDIEASLFEQLRVTIAKELHRIQQTASAVSRLDVFCSFAETARQNGYCRPTIRLSDRISIKDGRHPVVEQVLEDFPFVPNDALLDQKDNQIAIITGPNMAGKSTYMRQTALIVLMAQVGSFVPASSADIGIVDGIFTRIGASDDLTAGQSTFMVEMCEMASILEKATGKSLLLLDEIGRGTSTFDGMSIAHAMLEYIADPRKLGAKTLFATHYHELTQMEEVLPCVKNYNIAVKKRGDDITFLRKIIRGGADDSYGIEVSKLAGVPEWIIRRAHEILEKLESGQTVEIRAKKKKKPDIEMLDTDQVVLIGAAGSEVEDRLRKMDPSTLTPIEALTELYTLKGMLRS